ncbi:Os07g0296100, partial [Oryza sativa Japonica Group]
APVGGDEMRRLDLQAKDMIAAIVDAKPLFFPQLKIQGRKDVFFAQSKLLASTKTFASLIAAKSIPSCSTASQDYPFPSSAPAASTIKPFLTSTGIISPSSNSTYF